MGETVQRDATNRRLTMTYQPGDRVELDDARILARVRRELGAS